jgi:osmotically-inducible protein OsmY
MKISKKLSLTAFLLLFLTTSCVETVVVGSVAAGVVIARHKTVEETKNDTVIAAKLAKLFVENGLKSSGSYVEFSVDEGRVLLTGVVDDLASSRQAQDLSWKVEGVKEVIDEVEAINKMKSGFGRFTRGSRDYLVTAHASTKLAFARDVSSVNYKIITVNGSLYLFGIADNEFEMKKALAIVAGISGVSRVVNHVILKNDERRSQ